MAVPSVGPNRPGAQRPDASSRSTDTIFRRVRSSTHAVPDELRSPIKHHLMLHRIDPKQGIQRFYSLMIERDLSGTVRLVRNWGRISTKGQELVAVFASEIEAGLALEAVAGAKRRRGYCDL